MPATLHAQGCEKVKRTLTFLPLFFLLCTHSPAVLPNLRTLNVSNNKLESREDIAHLAECPSIQTLDISGNKIADQDALAVIQGLGNLTYLRLVGNPVVSNTRRVLAFLFYLNRYLHCWTDQYCPDSFICLLSACIDFLHCARFLVHPFLPILMLSLLRLRPSPP